MAKISVQNLNGDKVKDLSLNDKIWNIKVNEAVLYDAIVFAKAGLRQGTAKTKTRGEVAGGGRKPYRQKGTGSARQGSKSSPVLRRSISIYFSTISSSCSTVVSYFGSSIANCRISHSRTIIRTASLSHPVISKITELA